MIQFRSPVAWFVAMVVLTASTAHARDLLILESVGFRDSGHDMLELLEDFVDQEGAFAGLAGIVGPYDMSLDYLGIANAITATGTNPGIPGVDPFVLVLRFPITGFERTFTGTSDEDVENQVEDFFESGDGGRELAKFIQETNGRTELATLDGNPRSTTALLARGAFDRFGLGAERTRDGYRKAQIADWGHFDLTLEASGGAVDIDDFDSLYVVDGALTLGGDFEPGLGLYVTLVGQYRNYDEAEIYDVGGEIAIPISLIRPGAGSALRWTLTPFGQVGAGVSVNLLSGGLFAGGGAVNALAYHLGPFEIAMANELVYYGGIPLGDVGDFEIDTKLDQLITRNGGKLAFHPEGCDWISLEAGASVTNFLFSHALVDVYTTPFAGIELRPLRDLLRLRIGWESDLASDYAAHVGRVEIGLEF